jgi:hypothetical protein
MQPERRNEMNEHDSMPAAAGGETCAKDARFIMHAEAHHRQRQVDRSRTNVVLGFCRRYYAGN